MAALEMGVEGKANVVRLQEPPRERAGSGISHSAYDHGKRMRVWTAILKGSGPSTNKQIDLSQNTRNEVIVVDIQRRGEKLIRMVKIYDQ